MEAPSFEDFTGYSAWTLAMGNVPFIVVSFQQHKVSPLFSYVLGLEYLPYVRQTQFL